tara:strand:- start:153 stop:524 length:372 start_codon:yes stop_codon:yes gene_type:complete
MELNYKNSFRINIINLILNLLMIVSSVFTIFEIKEQFEFIELVVVVYSILYEIVMFVTIYAGILERNLPEFLEFMENGYVQILGFVLINLLLMDLSLVSLIIGSLILTYSIIFTIYNFCINKN